MWYSNLLNKKGMQTAAAPDGKPKKIVVTGTTGWLAGGVAKALVEAGHSVIGIARRKTEIEGVKGVQADIQNEDALTELFAAEKVDVLVHLAGALGWCDVRQAIDVNVAGTRKVVQAALNAGCHRIVVASSVAVIGTYAPMHPPTKLPMRVDEPFVGSNWPYALSKSMVEELIALMSKDPEHQAKADFIVVRIGNTVTDPPKIVHLDGVRDGKQIEEPVEPAQVQAKPYTEAEPKMFAEGPLTSVAYSDQVECLVHCAVRAPPAVGIRQIACVAPRPYSLDPVPDVMRSYYGEMAKDIDMSHYDDPKHKEDPVYDLQPGRDLGWEPKVDLLAWKLKEKAGSA